MKILITGGAGFIGSNLARAALASQTITGVTVLDDLTGGGDPSELEAAGVRVFQKSILDAHWLDRAMHGCDAVVHLAAVTSVQESVEDPIRCHSVNTAGTAMVLEAARQSNQRPQAIVASSASVYGHGLGRIQSESHPTRPLSPYAASKVAAEALTLAYRSSYDMQTLALRFFNVYGPGQRHDHPYAAAIPRLIHAALTGSPVPIHGDGHQTRDYTYVGDVCAVLLSAIRHRITDLSPVNLAFGTRNDLHEVLWVVQEITGREIHIRYEPARAADIRHSSADSSTLRRLFPTAVPHGLSAGLLTTVAWLESQLSEGPAQ